VNPLIRRWFGANSHKGVKFLLRRNIEAEFWDEKIFCWRSFGSVLLYPVGRSSSGLQGELNGLEDTKDRRSAGRHGNQHVCVRRPQISGCVSFNS
jgi:hypothetical protein